MSGSAVFHGKAPCCAHVRPSGPVYRGAAVMLGRAPERHTTRELPWPSGGPSEEHGRAHELEGNALRYPGGRKFLNQSRRFHLHEAALKAAARSRPFEAMCLRKRDRRIVQGKRFTHGSLPPLPSCALPPHENIVHNFLFFLFLFSKNTHPRTCLLILEKG